MGIKEATNANKILKTAASTIIEILQFISEKVVAPFERKVKRKVYHSKILEEKLKIINFYHSKISIYILDNKMLQWVISA